MKDKLQKGKKILASLLVTLMVISGALPVFATPSPIVLHDYASEEQTAELSNEEITEDYGKLALKIDFENITATSPYPSLEQLGGAIYNQLAGTTVYCYFHSYFDTAFQTSIGNDGSTALKLVSKYNGYNAWYIREVSGSDFQFLPSGKYTLVFDAKYSSVPTNTMVYAYYNNDYESMVMNIQTVPDTNWNTYTMTFDLSDKKGLSRLDFYTNLSAGETIEIDNVMLYTDNSDMVKATDFTLDKSFVQIGLDDTVQLNTVIEPFNTSNQNVKWTTSNSSVATVYNGKIKAVSAGTATITATTLDGNLTDTCEVVVISKGLIYEMTFEPYHYSSAYGNYFSSTFNKLPYAEETYVETGLYQTFEISTGRSGKGLRSYRPEFAGTSTFTLYGRSSSMNGKALILLSGNEYTVQFDAKFDSPAPTEIGCSFKEIYYDSYAYGYIGSAIASDSCSLVSEEWSTYSFDLDVTNAPGNVGSLNISFGTTERYQSVYLDNLKIYAKGADNVYIYNVTDVLLDKTTAEMVVNDTLQLNATVLPTEAANKNIIWTSSDDSIATVTDGIVTAKSAGTATITATTEDGNKTATCVITVTNPPSQNAPSTLCDYHVIKTTSPSGMRFHAQVPTSHTATAIGWIVTTKDILDKAGIDNDSFTKDCDVLYVKGENYNKDEGKNVIFNSDGGVDTFSAVLTGVTAENYDMVIVARPYVIDDDGTWYGQPYAMSVRNVAQVMKASGEYDSFADDQKAVIEAILEGQEI